MRKPLLIILSTLFVAAAGGSRDSKYLLSDPSAAHRVDYLILTVDRFVDTIDELAAYREKKGYKVGIVTMAAVKAKYDSIRTFLAHAVRKWKKPAPTYLLIVGDVDSVPAVIRDGEFSGFQSEKDLATDYEYACPIKPLDPLLHVGRFSCANTKELSVLVRKTIDYETKLKPGAWQKKIAFITGEAGFSKELDTFIEKQFRKLVGGGIPAEYDIEVAFASPRSPYCPYPPKFHKNALRLLNEGSLFYVFVGHGSKFGVDRIRWNGKSFDILKRSHAPEINVKAGLPIMVVIACNTGQYDYTSDCVGETFFKRPKGPVAFLGGSRVTQPYGNGLLGKALIDHVFGDAKTLGEALTLAKKQVVAHKKSKFTTQADFMASMVQGPKGLPLMRRDVVRHYNLLGDPALVLRKPRKTIHITRKGNEVEVVAAASEVRLTLECTRNDYIHPLEKRIKNNDPEFEKKITVRYRNANDKVIGAWKLDLVDGFAKKEIEIPRKKGKYLLKAHSGGQVGILEFEIKE